MGFGLGGNRRHVEDQWVVSTTQRDRSRWADFGLSTQHNMILIDNHAGDRQRKNGTLNV